VLAIAAHRRHHAPTRLELPLERRWNLVTNGRGDIDGIERGLLGQAQRAVADDERHVFDPELSYSLLRERTQLGVALDRPHVAGERRQQCGVVAGAVPMSRTRSSGPSASTSSILATTSGCEIVARMRSERDVVVCPRALGIEDELVAGQPGYRLQDALIPDGGPKARRKLLWASH